MVLDPVTALGVAGNVLQFVDFGSRVLSTFRDIKANGGLPKIETLDAFTRASLDLTLRLQQCPPSTSRKNAASWEVGILKANERCQRAAKILVNALEKTRRLHGERFGAIRQAFSSVVKEKEISVLARDLDTAKTELTLHLVAYLSAQHDSDLEELLRASKSAETAFLKAVRKDYEDLGGQIGRLKAVVQEENSATQKAISDWQSTSGTELARKLANIAENTRRQVTDEAQMRMLVGLYFVQWGDREAMISKAHKSTFSWIFGDEFASSLKGAKFTDWLENDQPKQGLFYIRGKPGAGKSCLMRYLTTYPQLTAFLQRWAGSRKLLLASCFFWRAGTALQKSLTGMLRSLLYQLLKQEHSLMQIAHPERWHAYYYGQSDLDDWSEQELTASIARLFSLASDSFRFVILVDGLDEYEGTEAQRQNLVNFFVRIASEHDNVKICVSSRPWPVFQEGLKKFSSLSLEDLTRRDVATYVRDHFEEDVHFRELRAIKPTQCDNLQSQIVDKAQGVFLWVILVVRDLLQRLQNGATITNLFKRLDMLPAELDDFFMQIIESIDASERADAGKIFQIVTALPKTHRTVLTLSFTEEEHIDFALHLEAEDLTEQAIHQLISSAKRRLNSRCKGLLEMGAEIKRAGWVDWQVEFLHRTVYDFFCQSQLVRARLNTYTSGSVDVSRYMCNASLVEFLALADTDHLPAMHTEAGEDGIATAVTFLQYASQNDCTSGSAPLSLLSVFRQRIIEKWDPWGLRDCARVVMFNKKFSQWRSVHPFTHWQGDRGSFLGLAVQFSLTRFLRSQLDASVVELGNGWNLDRLLDLALEPVLLFSQERAKPSPEVVALLLQRAQRPLTDSYGRKSQTSFEDKAAKVTSLLARYNKQFPDEKMDVAWADVLALLIDHGLFRRVVPPTVVVGRQVGQITKASAAEFLGTEGRECLRANFEPVQVERLEDLIFRKEYEFVDTGDIPQK
ncbi:NACHT domain-containing protein [Cladophialophora immunda]|nr:NACHT domain-containing protein [Cladophialophora immunda]